MNMFTATNARKALRPPEDVMRLSRLGCFFPTRLSFIPQLLRRAQRESWQFSRTIFDMSSAQRGIAVYRVQTPARIYSLLVFAHSLPPEQERNDRVIAQQWDATFNLIDGDVTADDIARLSAQTPKQEAGRFTSKELVLSRANKSMRLFTHCVDALAAGQQPDASILAQVGYLMRTTAVYGSGKFGCADRQKTADRPECKTSFQIEMLAVYLFRWFSIDWVNHAASVQGGDQATELCPTLAMRLGVGNSTGLGMSPFLIKNHQLVHCWMQARETALARVRGQAKAADQDGFMTLFDQAQYHLEAWQVDDTRQMCSIRKLRKEMQDIRPRVTLLLDGDYPWDALIRLSMQKIYSTELEELMVALILFPHGELIDDLGETMQCSPSDHLDPACDILSLRRILHDHYAWAMKIDFNDTEQSARVWYYSADKVEPRLGTRDEGLETYEIPLAIAKDTQKLHKILDDYTDQQQLADVLADHPYLRTIIRRVQTAPAFPYGEIHNNMIGNHFRPIDLLRAKLSLFGVMHFDPKSDLWLRVNMYQGYPIPPQLALADLESPALAFPAPSSADNNSPVH